MTQNVSMRHKFLPWEGILYCTDGIEAALIDQHINTLYIVVIDNLDDVNKEALKLSLESTSQSEENKAPKKPKISVSKLNQLLAHYEL